MRKTSTTTMPFYKVDGGKFLAETLGYSSAEVGIYARLMAIYWERGCKLPTKELLEKILQATTKKEREALETVLDTFFPDGVHEHLDLCLSEAKAFSTRQSANARKGHDKKLPQGEPEQIPEEEITDF